MWPFHRKPATKGRATTRHPVQPEPLNRRTQRVPDRISKFYVPQTVLQATEVVMQRFGDEKRECYVWWSGCFDAQANACVLTALCPDIATQYGCVQLGTTELLTLHAKLRSLDQLLLMELHTHPPEAGGQNDVDAAHPAAPYCGFVSVVVPNFAFPRFELRTSYIYEYLEQNRWRELETEEIARRFVVEPNFVSVKV